jgi:hypothetical protein
MKTPDKDTDWAWLKDTYWYVLTPDLPAPQFDPDENTLRWFVDQTVWHIVGYKHGYIWGATSVMMYDAEGEAPTRGLGSRPTQLTLLGTVTPRGGVQLTFIPKRGPSSATTGFGQMVQFEGAWGFEMQMSTDRLGSRVLHWATMVQTRKGEASWEQLPGLPYSVPQMLEGATYPSVKGVYPAAQEGT